jgi:hypothetical protein
MARPTIILIAEATKKAAAGVDYSPRLGCLCPWCGERAKIYKTNAWEDGTRIRYHLCQNSRCVIAGTGKTIKSIEQDLICQKK